MPLRAVVRAAVASQSRRAGEIGVVLTDDAELRALNLRWRGLDRATDVLSFGYASAPTRPRGRGAATDVTASLLQLGDDRAVDGDLVISLDRVRVQARRFRVSRGRELARLAIHGALHLAGLDHQRAGERAHMRREEDRVLRGARAAVAALERMMR